MLQRGLNLDLEGKDPVRGDLNQKRNLHVVKAGRNHSTDDLVQRIDIQDQGNEEEDQETEEVVLDQEDLDQKIKIQD